MILPHTPRAHWEMSGEISGRYNWGVHVLSHSVVSDSVPMDCGPPGSSVHGILQARILEWVAMPFPRASSRPRGQIRISCVSCIDWQAGSLLLSHQESQDGGGGVKVRASPGVRIQDCISTSLGQDMRRWDFSFLSFFFFLICDHSRTVSPWKCELKLLILKTKQLGIPWGPSG